MLPAREGEGSYTFIEKSIGLSIILKLIYKTYISDFLYIQIGL